MGGADTPQLLHESRRWSRVWLGVLVLAWGIQAIVTQSLLLREALVLMFGSEFAWGIVLFAWLLGVAAGAGIGGWLSGRVLRADVALVTVLLVLSLAACVELWVFRGARAWLGVEPGELLPLPKTALAAMLFVSPASAPVGMAFPLACCVANQNEPRASARADVPNPNEPRASARADVPRRLRPAARVEEPRGWKPVARVGEPRGLKPAAPPALQLGEVYALESAGSLIGGAAFSFWAVEHLSPIQTALTCGAVTMAASAGFLIVNRRSLGCAFLGAMAIAAFLTSVWAGDALNDRLVQRRWRNVAPGYELCAEVESKYQNLAVGRRAEQFTLYCDGQVSADFPDPYTFVPLAHFWLCQHPSPRQVLVLGGGAEGLLAEILRHPIEHVDYIEPDPRQIELITPYLADTDRQALHAERLTVHHVDARYFVKTQRHRFDLVIARLPEPMSSLRARLYTDEFYRELRRAMTPRSVLCMTVAATPGSLTAASAEYLASIRATLARHFPHVTIGWGNPAQVLVATEAGLLSTDPGELAERYARRGIESGWFDAAWFDGATDWLDPDKLQQRTAELDAAQNVEISTDLHPVVYMQRLTLWERMTSGQSGRVIEWLRSVHWPDFVFAFAMIAGVTLLACDARARWARSRRSAHTDPPYRWFSDGTVILSVGTTGFTTMALSIVWLFAFQNLYGYVYQRIGWIIALFMGGLVVGCELVRRRSRRISGTDALRAFLWRWLILVDLLLMSLALAVPLILRVLGRLQTSPLALTLVEWCVSIMVALTGVLGGAVFPLAGGLHLKTTGRSVGSTAAAVDGADHAGACLGALACGILLVPVFGTVVAALLLAGIKLGSAGLLLMGRRASPATG